MKVIDERVEEILVERHPALSHVEVQIGTESTAEVRMIRLTRDEARRLAALILFQAAKLDRPRHRWGLTSAEPERKSA